MDRSTGRGPPAAGGRAGPAGRPATADRAVGAPTGLPVPRRCLAGGRRWPRSDRAAGGDAGGPDPASSWLRVGLARWPWAGLAALAPILAFADELGDLLPLDIDGEAARSRSNLPQNNWASDLVVTAMLVAAVAMAAVVAGTVLGLAPPGDPGPGHRVGPAAWCGPRPGSGVPRACSAPPAEPRPAAGSRPSRTDRDADAAAVRHPAAVRLPTIGQGDLVIPGATSGGATTGSGTRSSMTDPRAGPRPPPSPPGGCSSTPGIVCCRSGSSAVVVAWSSSIGWWGLALAAIGRRPDLRWMTARRQWRLWRWGIGPGPHRRLVRQLVNRQHHRAGAGQGPGRRGDPQSFFERRRGLATVRITVGRGRSCRSRFLPLAEAEAVRDLSPVPPGRERPSGLDVTPPTPLPGAPRRPLLAVDGRAGNLRRKLGKPLTGGWRHRLPPLLLLALVH